MNGVQTRLKCKPNVKRCKRFVFAAHSPLLHPNTLKTKAIIHFQTDHILTRFVFPPLHTTISIKLNEQGFHDIFNKYYVTLCLFANQYTENQETSADIVQDSFAKLWQIREDFFYLHQVKAFLYTAVRNKALNELEHSKVVYEYAQNVIEKKKDSFFHDAIVEEETYRIVSEAINKLPDQMKAIMQLSLEGKKNAEIADRLNISTETVHTLKKIAYKKLRENLKDYYYFLLFFI